MLTLSTRLERDRETSSKMKLSYLYVELFSCVDFKYACIPFISILAVPCSRDAECLEAGTSCVTNYCQITPCSTTGQCVFGQMCSRYGNAVCLGMFEGRSFPNNRTFFSFNVNKATNILNQSMVVISRKS